MKLIDKGLLTIMRDKSMDICHAQIKMSDNEFCDVILASVDGQKFKAYKVILSVSNIFFKKLLVNKFNHHPLIFMRRMKDESCLLHKFTLTKQDLIFIRLNKKKIEEAI